MVDNLIPSKENTSFSESERIPRQILTEQGGMSVGGLMIKKMIEQYEKSLEIEEAK